MGLPAGFAPQFAGSCPSAVVVRRRDNEAVTRGSSAQPGHCVLSCCPFPLDYSLSCSAITLLTVCTSPDADVANAANEPGAYPDVLDTLADTLLDTLTDDWRKLRWVITAPDAPTGAGHSAAGGHCPCRRASCLIHPASATRPKLHVVMSCVEGPHTSSTTTLITCRYARTRDRTCNAFIIEGSE